MTQAPWLGDACGLVDAYRSRTLHPREVLEATYAAIDASSLNAVSYTDRQAAFEAASTCDVSLPLGGVPVGVKELDATLGWPKTSASLALRDEVATYDSTYVARLRTAGAVLAAQTTASEFGGINCTTTRLHGSTHNPWKHGHTPGGSSGGSAAGVAGGLFPLATGGDGGGSIRIPAGFSGLVGLKATYGRIPRGPFANVEPLTTTLGCVARSVRDVARFFDVTNGADPFDPLSLPRVAGWEAGLGSIPLEGLRVAVSVDLGAAVVSNAVRAAVDDAADALIAELGWRRVEVPLSLPRGGFEWSMAGSIALLVDLGERYPACADELTPEMAASLRAAQRHAGLDAMLEVERFRRASIRAMGELFDEVDLILCASNPDVAFSAEGPMATVVDGVDLVATLGLGTALGNNGALTIPCNTTGNPAISIPVGTSDGLPIGMQVIGRHHAEPLLLELAAHVERVRPWPLVAPGAPC
jgi:aspartyl-tRNA(Asn)/glutamyl-tRNA(Gln) amidotransferase subunit A